MKPTADTTSRLVLGVLVTVWSTAASAQSFSLSVDSKANLYAAGQATLPLLGGGTLPPAIALTPGTGRVLTFASVSGSVSYNDVDAPPIYLGQYNGPDGGVVNFQDANWPNNYLTTSGTPGLLPPSAANAPMTFYMDMASAGGFPGSCSTSRTRRHFGLLRPQLGQLRRAGHGGRTRAGDLGRPGHGGRGHRMPPAAIQPARHIAPLGFAAGGRGVVGELD